MRLDPLPPPPEPAPLSRRGLQLAGVRSEILQRGWEVAACERLQAVAGVRVGEEICEGGENRR